MGLPGKNSGIFIPRESLLLYSNCDLMTTGQSQWLSTVRDSGQSQWLSTVRDSLHSICADIWNNCAVEFNDFLTKMVFDLLKEKRILQWKNSMQKQPAPERKLRIYSKFKLKFEFEN